MIPLVMDTTKKRRRQRALRVTWKELGLAARCCTSRMEMKGTGRESRGAKDTSTTLQTGFEVTSRPSYSIHRTSFNPGRQHRSGRGADRDVPRKTGCGGRGTMTSRRSTT